jgi:hypothetical protein
MPGWSVAPQTTYQSLVPTAPAMPTMRGLPSIPSLSMGYGGNSSRSTSVLGGAGRTMDVVRDAFAGNMDVYGSPLDAAANTILNSLTRGRTSTVLNSFGAQGFEEDLKNTSRIILGR